MERIGDRGSPAPTGSFVLGYCRVSTDEQAEHGSSLADQERQIRAYCEQHGLILDDVVTETFSGARPDRPGFDKLLARARRAPGRYAWILVAVSDRAERFNDDKDRARFLYRLTEVGLDILDISRPFKSNETAAARAANDVMTQVIKAFAGYERTMIAERTRRGRENRARAGLFWGGRRPFGYQFAAATWNGRESRTGKLEVDPDEAEVVKHIFELFVAGASITAIARLLNRESPHLVPTGSAARQAGRWSASAVRNVLANPVYSGRMFVNKTEGRLPLAGDPHRRVLKSSRIARPREEWIEVPGGAPAIVSEQIWNEARDRLASNRRSTIRARYPYILTGLLYHSCGQPMTGHARRKPELLAVRDLHGPPATGRVDRDGNFQPAEPPVLGHYNPHRYYACESCDVLVLSFKIENVLWAFARRLFQENRLQPLAMKPDDYDPAAAQRRSIQSKVRRLEVERMRLRETQANLPSMIHLDWNVLQDMINNTGARLSVVEAELDAASAELLKLAPSGTRGMNEMEWGRALDALQLQDGYYSSRLWALTFAYIFERVIFGRRGHRRNQGYLDVTLTQRLGGAGHALDVPFSVGQLVRSLLGGGNDVAPVILVRPLIFTYGPTGEEIRNKEEDERRDAERLIAAFGPLPPHRRALNLSPTEEPQTLARWFEIQRLSDQQEVDEQEPTD